MIWVRTLEKTLKMVCPKYIQDLHVSSFTESLGCEKVLPEIIAMLVTSVERNSFSH